MDDDIMLLSKQFKLVNANFKELKFPKKTLICFSDGSCTNNGKKTSVGGYSVLWLNGAKHGDITMGKVPDKDIPATNIRAEYYGVKTYLDYLKKDIKNSDWNSSVLYSDSQFWIKMIEEYMPKWSKSKFETKANSDITLPLWILWNELQNSGKSVSIKHIYAHNKDNSANSLDPIKRFHHDNNKIVDELATMARKLPDYEVVCLTL